MVDARFAQRGKGPSILYSRSFLLSLALAICVLIRAPLQAAPKPAPPAPAVFVPPSMAVPGLAEQINRGLWAYYQGKYETAVGAFQEAVRIAPECGLAYYELSRALLKAGKTPEARNASARAQALSNAADDREQRLIYAWASHIKGLDATTDAARKEELDREQAVLDYAIAVYPDDAELYVVRSESAENPLRAAPYVMAALSLQPAHPVKATWRKPAPPPLPASLPKITEIKLLNKPAEIPTLFDGLGNLEYKITTASPEAQKYFEQGMRLWHSYVQPSNVRNSAARCFHYATTLDNRCAMAWWGLSFSLTKDDAFKPMDAARNAYAIAMALGTDKEKRMAAARLLDTLGPTAREQFLDTLDGALIAYPDDVELWIWRGKVYGDYGHTESSTKVQVLAGIPFQLHAQRAHPEHPAPNHELIHGYEAIVRPALGWKYTVMFRRAAPNMPHAHHMQAHLAMRLGRWDDAIDATRTTHQRSLQGFPELSPGHHLSVLALALGHQGRFIDAERETAPVAHDISYARMLRMKDDPAGLATWVQRHAQHQTGDSVYVAAVLKIGQNDLAGAASLLKVLEEAVKNRKASYYQFREVQGRLLIASGKVDEGLRVFRETAKLAVNDAALHQFGGGGYFLEIWGEQALLCGKLQEAHLAFLEAMAHDHGSVIGALGLQVVNERLGRPDMVTHYAARASEIWKDADPGALDRQLQRLRKSAAAAASN
ncbi:MAG: tetratricopeptide repeat protein [Armatimonadetes bacterium]|nr:tetratricopeptide repeat protein [Armatimonadota bacterium]